MRIFLTYLSFVIFAISCADGIEIERPEYTAVEENRAVFGGGAIEAEERWKEMFNRITGNETVTASIFKRYIVEYLFG